MAEEAASSSSIAVDEFDDDGFNWGATVDTIAETEKKVKAAAEREEKIQKLIKEADEELREIARLRKEAGSGHPGKSGRKGYQ